MEQSDLNEILDDIENSYKHWKEDQEYERWKKEEQKKLQQYKKIACAYGAAAIIITAILIIVKKKYYTDLLYTSIQNNDQETVKEILAIYPNLKLMDPLQKNQSPLALADELNRKEIFLLLMTALESHQKPLDYSYSNEDELKKILNNIDDFETFEQHRKQLIKHLTRKGIGAKYINSVYNKALTYNDYELLALLSLENKFDSSSYGSPMFYAKSTSRVHYLKTRGFSISVKDGCHRSLLYYALESNNPTLVEEFNISHNRTYCVKNNNVYHELALLSNDYPISLETFLALYRASDEPLLSIIRDYDYYRKPQIIEKLPEDYAKGVSIASACIKKIYPELRKNPTLSTQEIRNLWNKTLIQKLSRDHTVIDFDNYRTFKIALNEYEKHNTLKQEEFPCLIPYITYHNDATLLKKFIDNNWLLTSINFEKELPQSFTPNIELITFLESNKVSINYTAFFFTLLKNLGSIESIKHCMHHLKEMPKDKNNNIPWHILANNCDKKDKAEYLINLTNLFLESDYTNINQANKEKMFPLDILDDKKIITCSLTCIEIKKIILEKTNQNKL